MDQFTISVEYNKPNTGYHPVSVFVKRSFRDIQVLAEFHGKQVRPLLVKAAKAIADELQPDDVAVS